MDNNISGLTFIILNVPNLDEAADFYTEKLGFNLLSKARGFAQFQPGQAGSTFALQENATSTPHTGVELWWQSNNADSVYDRLVARGVEIVSPPKDEPFGRAFSFKDLNNNTLNIFQLPQAG